MNRWSFGSALACGIAGLVADSASAQVQVQVQPAQVQVQKIQVQVQPIQAKAQAQIQVARPAIMPIMYQQLLTQADAVVLGRVIGVEPVDIEAAPAPNQAKVNYRIAVVQVNEIIHGVAKETKMLRVGYIAQPMNGNINGGIQVQPGVQIQIQPAIQPIPPGQAFPGRRPFPGYGTVALQVGQDGLFLLAKHHKESFYLVPNYTSFVTSQNNPNFENEVKNARQLGKVLENTTAALKSDEQSQRYLAAALLISKYRSNSTGLPMKQVPIDAEESKLILQALAGADWNAGRVSAGVPSAVELFHQLGITQNDGFKLPNIVRNQQDQTQAMQKWLDENKGKYVIKKLVADPNAKLPIGIDPKPGVIQPGGRLDLQPPPIRILPGNIRPLPAPLPPIEQDLPNRRDQ